MKLYTDVVLNILFNNLNFFNQLSCRVEKAMHLYIYIKIITKTNYF